MSEIRVIALQTELVNKVLKTKRAPGYGHPAYTELAKGYGPCRHCLRTFQVGEELRTLFTCKPFYMVAPLPSPGPVFVHTEGCERYDEAAGYPQDMLLHPAVMDGYDLEQQLVARRTTSGGNHEMVLSEMFEDATVRYVMVRDHDAGCFDFRVERLEGGDGPEG